MRTFAGWLLSRRHWLALLAVALVQFLPPVACALLIADGARNGPRRAGPLAAIVLLAALAMSLGVGASFGLAATGSIATVVAGAGLGALLWRSRRLELTFQVGMLVGLLLAALFALAGPAPEAAAAPVLEQLAEFMTALGGSTAQIERVRSLDPVLLLGSLLAGVVAQVMAALMLGGWLWSTGQAEGTFARQFTALRLGRIVGVTAIVVLTLSLFVTFPALQYMGSVAVVGFLVQGLAVVHAWLQAKAWHWSAAAAVYAGALLLSSVVVTALCAVGLLDNFFSLRRPLETDAS